MAVTPGVVDTGLRTSRGSAMLGGRHTPAAEWSVWKPATHRSRVGTADVACLGECCDSAALEPA